MCKISLTLTESAVLISLYYSTGCRGMLWGFGGGWFFFCLGFFCPFFVVCIYLFFCPWGFFFVFRAIWIIILLLIIVIIIGSSVGGKFYFPLCFCDLGKGRLFCFQETAGFMYCWCWCWKELSRAELSYTISVAAEWGLLFSQSLLMEVLTFTGKSLLSIGEEKRQRWWLWGSNWELWAEMLFIE